MKKLTLILIGGFFLVQSLFAQTEDEEEFAPELPDPMESGQAINPEVTIIHREKEMVEEYRINGNLYMVKITPTVGRPYYLIDNDGDGSLEKRISNAFDNPAVPQWPLFNW